MTTPGFLHFIAHIAVTVLAVSLLIPGSQAFSLPFNFFLRRPIDTTVPRVNRPSRQDIYKTDIKKPSLLRFPREGSVQETPDTGVHPKGTSPDAVYIEPRLKVINDNSKRKREGGGCIFHAGLAHNCDYKSLVRAFDDVDHWNSFMSPGKKKRSGGGFLAARRRPTSNTGGWRNRNMMSNGEGKKKFSDMPGRKEDSRATTWDDA